MSIKWELKSSWAFVFTQLCDWTIGSVSLQTQAYSLSWNKGLLARMGAKRGWRTWQRSQNQNWVLMSSVVTLGCLLAPKLQITTTPWLRLGLSDTEYLVCLTKDFLLGSEVLAWAGVSLRPLGVLLQCCGPTSSGTLDVSGCLLSM